MRTGLQIRHRKILGIGTGVLVVFAFSLSAVFAQFSQNNVYADSINTTDFVTTWKTDNTGDSCDSCMLLRTYGYSDYSVDWDNDGEYDETYSGTSNISHDFGVPGIYTIRISGDINRVELRWSDAKKITQINQWGSAPWTNFNSTFEGATNLDVTATDAPDLSRVTDMRYMFEDNKNLRGSDSFNDWDVSNVRDMTSMFNGASQFNSSISSWDVSNVTDMGSMFEGASQFNGDVSSWDVSNVTSVDRMFYNAESFNQPLNDWDVSNINSMAYMFNNALDFNQPLDRWDMSTKQSLVGLFAGATSFNQPLDSWDVSNVANMNAVFFLAGSFNQPLDNWDVSSATQMNGMFYWAESFNQPLNDWNVSNVTDMGSMFDRAGSFDQSLDNWSVSNVTEMSYMLSRSAMSITNYDNTLQSWSVQPLQNNVTLHADNLSYCVSSASRQSIITNFSWTINGDSLRCGTLYIDGDRNIIERSGTVQSGDSIGTLSVEGFIPTNYQIGCETPGDDDAFFRVDDSTNQVLSRNTLDALSPQDQYADNSYEFCVVANDEEGRRVEHRFYLILSIIPQAPEVRSVEFTQEAGRTVLHVRGVGFGEPGAGLSMSLVKLNGSDLAFCSNGFGRSAEDIANDYGIDPARVTDAAPCYYLINEDGATIAYTYTNVKILLPPSFNTSKKGTVAVNGSSVYTFNALDGSGEGTKKPTAFVNSGSGSLKGVPVISKRPTFSGTATPGAKITVTVHSDPVSCSAIADESGNWTCTLPSNLEPGAHTVYIRVVNPDNTVENLGPYKVRVGSGAATVTNETPLAPNTGFMSILQDMQSEKAKDKTIAHILAAVAGGAFVLLIAYVIHQRKLARF